MPSTPSDQTIVLISGANQGLGWETVKKLAAEQANYTILLGSRNLQRGQEAAGKITDFAKGTSIDPVELDMDNDDSIAKAASYVEEKYGRLDVLFNNAAIATIKGMAFRELFNKVLATNVTGYACVTEAFIPLLRKAQLPRLVFMSSGLGSVTDTLDPTTMYHGLGNDANLKPYIVSKGADNLLGVLYAVQLGKEGFKVNLVDPGYRATNMNGHSEGATHASLGAVQAAKMIVNTDKDGPHATFSCAEKFLPW